MCLVAEEHETRKFIKLDPGDRLSRLLEMRQFLFHWIVTHHRTMTAHAFFGVRKPDILSVSRRKMTLLACDPGNRVAAVTERNRLRRRGEGGSGSWRLTSCPGGNCVSLVQQLFLSRADLPFGKESIGYQCCRTRTTVFYVSSGTHGQHNKLLLASAPHVGKWGRMPIRFEVCDP